LIAIILSLNQPVFASDNKCLEAINNYEKIYHIPTGLLKAVSKVESEYNPLAINDGSVIKQYSDANELKNHINALRAQGKTNFDVGCMQINYHWHGKEFASIADMIDIDKNVHYAAKFLAKLFNEKRSWHKAVRFYHSNDPQYYRKYSRKIAVAWLKE
jgi:soluble lytic murein transglycosylase-like protein